MGLLGALLCAAVASGAEESPARKAASGAVRPGGSEVFELPGEARAETQIDKLVFPKVAALGVRPVLCSDAVFVRRAYLDVIGKLPTAQEARRFILDSSPGKRQALVDHLLQREEFADYWSMRWGDVLRIKAEFPVNLWPNAAQAYHRWVRASLASNKPYDQFVREILISSGSNFRVGEVNFYRAIQNRTPEGIAAAVALTFMGTRLDTWPEDRVAGLAVFFSQIGYKPTNEWKEETVFWDPLNSSATPGNVAPGLDSLAKSVEASNQPVPKPAGGGKEPPKEPDQGAAPSGTGGAAAAGPLAGVFPDGTKVKLTGDRDPRAIFADWLLQPSNPWRLQRRNPWFTRAIANRVWAWLMGRGIIHEPDDIRDGNPPSNPELLAYLEKELVANKYDLKSLYRLILNSGVYQLSSVPKTADPQAERHFASYPIRRLDAEVLIDAINQITGTSELYTSAIPEPFTYIPSNKPAVAIADGSITSPFLTLFGRAARATGMESERTNKVLPAQWLYLLNSSHIQGKIDQSAALKALFEAKVKPEQTAEELYLAVLSRFPTAEEVKRLEDYGKEKGKKRKEDWVDITWSLLNSSEFLFKH